MFQYKMVVLCLLASLMFVVSGCANYSGSAYGGRETRSAQSVQYGTVTNVRDVVVDDNSGGTVGALGGGVVGGVLGSMVGHGRGRTLATVGGALLGAGAGYAGEKAIAKQNAYEIEVQLESGQILSVVQGRDESFSVGERVRVLTGANGSARVSR